MSSQTLFFVAGEASGDTHGAGLMRALRDLSPDMRFIGRGGPRMREVAGDEFIDWSEHSSVLGLWEVLKQYGYFRQQFAATIAQIRESNPDAVVLIDYPGFNLRLARALRTQLPKLKIIYYISPQVWAWNRRRIPKMARYLDLMLCIFPFEAELYNQSGLRTVFVGHPMIESLQARRISGGREGNLIGLFPGSRGREIRKILPIMFGAAMHILRAKPNVRFEIAAASANLAQQIQAGVAESGLQADAVRVTIGEASATMQRASVGMVASGTATLEAAYFRMPFILVYRVAWLTYVAARMVVRVAHIGMPNVLAGRQIVPEFIQDDAQPDLVGEAVLTLLHSEHAREQMVANFGGVIAGLGETGASFKAAEVIVRELEAAGSR
jgi:lipid-A-disaccharide synthase